MFPNACDGTIYPIVCAKWVSLASSPTNKKGYKLLEPTFKVTDNRRYGQIQETGPTQLEDSGLRPSSGRLPQILGSIRTYLYSRVR